mmetsp:Transcript_62599/g.167178  ORF Transcript_62599/g.167178 Transcript_62599/m.167178 type:complete len:212 (-) Transcript_62599:82-717(-)
MLQGRSCRRRPRQVQLQIGALLPEHVCARAEREELGGEGILLPVDGVALEVGPRVLRVECRREGGKVDVHGNLRALVEEHRHGNARLLQRAQACGIGARPPPEADVEDVAVPVLRAAERLQGLVGIGHEQSFVGRLVREGAIDVTADRLRQGDGPTRLLLASKLGPTTIFELQKARAVVHARRVVAVGDVFGRGGDRCGDARQECEVDSHD